MVIDQGTILDRIDYNIEMVGVDVENAHGELVEAYKAQENRCGKVCIILLGGVVGILFLVVVTRRRGETE
jgi:syntaxin 16